MTALTFLGTGNFSAPGRYWNSFVVDRTVLVEPSPTVLPHLGKCEIGVDELEVILVSHFHADHTFGWPFLLLSLLRKRAGRPLWVVGPPGIDRYLREMTAVANIPDVQRAADDQLDLRFIEADGTWQDAGPLRVRGVEVEHVPYLRCFGYLLDRESKTVGYSGDTHPCDGLDELAGATDVLVLECNGRHPYPSHMDTEAVRDLQRRHPSVRLILTHLGADVDASQFEGITLPDDFQTLEV
jgi:ribonuclease BN (tRNA processing enzyme)